MYFHFRYHSLKLDYLKTNCLDKLPPSFRGLGDPKDQNFENISS